MQWREVRGPGDVSDGEIGREREKRGGRGREGKGREGEAVERRPAPGCRGPAVRGARKAKQTQPQTKPKRQNGGDQLIPTLFFRMQTLDSRGGEGLREEGAAEVRRRGVRDPGACPLREARPHNLLLPVFLQQ